MAEEVSDIVIEAAKRVVRILARRRRATGEPALRAIYEREGGARDAYPSAVKHAVLHGWITRRPDSALTGPSMEGIRAAGMPVRYGRAVTSSASA